MTDVAIVDLTEGEARSLTDRIKHHVHTAGVLITQAWESRVDKILGYPSWSVYCQQEFGIQARESRYLIQVARVQAAIGNALPLSIRAARAVEHNLSEVQNRIAQGEPPELVVVDVIELDRRQSANHRQVGSFDFCYYLAAPSEEERTRNGLPGYPREDVPDTWEIRDKAFPMRPPTTRAEVEPWCIELARAIYREIMARPLPTMPRTVQL